MQDDDITKIGSLRAKLLSFSLNEKVICIVFSVVAVFVVLLSFWYSCTNMNNIEHVVYTFAVAAQCSGALVLLLEVFGESEKKQILRTLGNSSLRGEHSGNSVPTEIIRIKASEIASKKASAVILLAGYATAFAANAPESSIEALVSFILSTVGIILVVQSYAIWKMIKFQGENINLNEFYNSK
jgi:hypothetical protein